MAAKVTGVETEFMPHVCCPRFAAIQQNTKYAGLVNLKLDTMVEVTITPDSFLQSAKGGRGFANPDIKLNIKGVGITDCGTEVGEAVHSVE